MKLYSWNVLFSNPAENVRAFIENLDFDVMCLQEVTEEMLTDLKKLPYQMVTTVDVVRHAAGGERCTNYLVILSKFPILSSGTISFPDLPVPWQTALYIGFMRWNRMSGRTALYADLEIHGMPLRVYSVHLTLWAPDNRLREFTMVAETLPTDRPTIVAGDFNVLEWWPMKLLNWLLGGTMWQALPWYPERARMEGQFLRYELRNILRRKVTHKLSRSQLDHILISNELSARGAHVERDSHGSDHRPVSAVLDI